MTRFHPGAFVDEQILIYRGLIDTLEQGERTEDVTRQLVNLYASVTALSKLKREQSSEMCDPATQKIDEAERNWQST